MHVDWALSRPRISSPCPSKNPLTHGYNDEIIGPTELNCKGVKEPQNIRGSITKKKKKAKEKKEKKRIQKEYKKKKRGMIISYSEKNPQKIETRKGEKGRKTTRRRIGN